MLEWRSSSCTNFGSQLFATRTDASVRRNVWNPNARRGATTPTLTAAGRRWSDKSSSPSQTTHWQQDWPIDARSRKFGENGLAYMVCQQELEQKYVSTAVVYAGAKQRCKMIAEEKDRSSWTVSLKDGETAAIVGLLADGSVVAQISEPGREDNAGQLLIWTKDKPIEMLPWIPRNSCGSVQSATPDMSRYAVFATCDDNSANGHWMVFDRKVSIPIADRRFPRNGRAALSPDGLHYASFESGELRVYSLANSR